VYLLPEDRANSEIATGFRLNVSSDESIETLEEAGGWLSVLEIFRRDHIKGMKRFPARMLVLLLDFDQDEGRLAKALAEIPDDLKNRVFVLGVWSEPEDLRRDLHISLEAIGQELAEACLADEFVTSRWNHPLLNHNADELNRLRQHVRPILFP